MQDVVMASLECDPRFIQTITAASCMIQRAIAWRPFSSKSQKPRLNKN